MARRIARAEASATREPRPANETLHGATLPRMPRKKTAMARSIPGDEAVLAESLTFSRPPGATRLRTAYSLPSPDEQ